MEEKLNKNKINDDILTIVKGFIDYFEGAEESLNTIKDEKK